MELPSKPADKAVRDGGATYIRPPRPHRFIIRMKPAARRCPLCLVRSSPYNLRCSHTLPFRPTSNPYSPFHSADTPRPPSPSPSVPLLTTAATRLPPLVATRLFLLHPSFPRSRASDDGSPSYSPECLQNRPASSVMKLDCHLLPAGTSPSLWVSRTAAGETEQHCHLLWMQIQLSS